MQSDTSAQEIAEDESLVIAEAADAGRNSEIQSGMRGVSGSALRRFCKSVAADGRDLALYDMLTMESYDPKKCVLCKQFLKVFAQSCKPRLPISEVEGQRQPRPEKSEKRVRINEYGSYADEEEQPTSTPEPTPTPAAEPSEEGGEPVSTPKPTPTPVKIIKQREPSIEVIEQSAIIFAELAELRNAPLILPVIEHLASLYRMEEYKTPAEREYFTTLAEYMIAPFHYLQVEAERHAGKEDAIEWKH